MQLLSLAAFLLKIDCKRNTISLFILPLLLAWLFLNYLLEVFLGVFYVLQPMKISYAGTRLQLPFFFLQYWLADCPIPTYFSKILGLTLTTCYLRWVYAMLTQGTVLDFQDYFRYSFVLNYSVELTLYTIAPALGKERKLACSVLTLVVRFQNLILRITSEVYHVL